MSWQLASFVVLGAVLIGGFAWYERSRPPSQIVALVAALAALAVAGRVVVAAIPNVVATTDIVIFSGYALGAAPGFVVGALAGLISNFWLGQGPWTPWQMAGWGLAGMLGAVLARVTRRRAGRIELTLACGFAGIAYGALLNFSLMVSYGGEFTLDRWLTLEARAVPFDLAHAIGNVTLALVAGPAMVRMLMRFRERFEFRWQPDPQRGPTRPGLAGAATALLVVLVLVSAAAPRSASAARAPAPAWLERGENADGGFPATPGQESNTQMTGWAMLGLEAAGINPLDVGRAGHSPVDYLRANIADVRTPGDLARTILALSGAGVDAHRFAGHDLAAKLAGRRRPDGSYQGWPNSTAFAVMALRASSARAGIGRSLAWLRRVQGDDGGWGAVRGAPGDPDSTGAVLQALGGGSRAAQGGVRFLRRSQQAGGGWGLAASGPVNSQSTAWAIQGLLAAGVDPSSVRHGGHSGLDYLSGRRASDGHYRYSSSSDQTPVWVTGQALVAAQLKPFPLAVPRAAGSNGGASAGAGSSSGGSASGSGRGGAAGGRGGGAGAPPERFAGERGKRKEGSSGGKSSEAGVRAGSGTAPTPKGSGAKQHPSTNTAFAANGDDRGSSPLVPIAIALGAGGLVLGGAWWASRRPRV
ncbi:MAG: prenyltransferase/squalene oxidase repeat-containing protein [Actinomycetota bacterium]